MSIRVPLATVETTIERALSNAGVPDDVARECAHVHASSSCDGVESHGLNRVPRFVDYVRRGWVDPNATPELVGAKGAAENYDGHLGPGITNAEFCMDRAVELAKVHGIGCVTLRNTTHWMRGGTYAWRAAEAGFIGMCWTNTEAAMPMWGSTESRVGNNPFCVAIPRANGSIVLDMAMALDLAATIMAAGKSGHDLDVEDQGSCTGACQVFIAFDPYLFGDEATIQRKVDERVESADATTPIDPAHPVTSPGERTAAARERNLREGVPVDETIWAQVQELADGRTDEIEDLSI